VARDERQYGTTESQEDEEHAEYGRGIPYRIVRVRCKHFEATPGIIIIIVYPTRSFSRLIAVGVRGTIAGAIYFAISRTGPNGPFFFLRYHSLVNYVSNPSAKQHDCLNPEITVGDESRSWDRTYASHGL
jgi:hypothetical protein